MNFEERTYRSVKHASRFDYYELKYRETDLMVGISKGMREELVRKRVLVEIKRLRKLMDDFIAQHPSFGRSLVPVEWKTGFPEEARLLAEAAEIAGTGPMAGIAGLFSAATGTILKALPGCNEVLVENGGDIYADVEDELVVRVFAGTSPLSDQLGIRLPAGRWGVCTSSGTVGPSLSFGTADAVTVVTHSAVLSDTLATALANRVRNGDDINACLSWSEQFGDIVGVVIVAGEKVGIKGSIGILPLN